MEEDPTRARRFEEMGAAMATTSPEDRASYVEETAAWAVADGDGLVTFPPAAQRVLREAGVAVAWLFGSRVVGRPRPDSDLDIAVLAHAGRPPFDLRELSRISRLLRGLVPAEPDVISFERAPLPLRARVVLEGHLVFSDDEPLRVATTVLTQSRWEDVRPALADMEQAYLARVAAHGMLAGTRDGVADPTRVTAKLAALATYLERLRVLRDLNEDDYLKGHVYEGRYLVQASAQVCIDLANHLIASSGWPPASEFRQSFERLGERGVIAADLAERLQDLTGLRNRLVHLYDSVDDVLVHRALVDGLTDLDDFARAYARWVSDTTT